MFVAHRLRLGPATNIYSHIQAKYWEVGLFAYYQWKQVPNFALAVPIVATVGWGCYKYVIHSSAQIFKKQGTKSDSLIETAIRLPFYVHLVLLCAYGVLTINIQVCTSSTHIDQTDDEK